MELSDLPKDKKIILFDGVCNLCEESVRFIIKHDKKDHFRFVALQSELGNKIVSHIGADQKHIDSILLYEPGKAYYYKAEAVMMISYGLGGFYKLLKLFSILPNSLLNRIYDCVARNRYKWYGKKEVCMVPTPELNAKFLT
jgi:predicted DCC family thiol-disulfide oxidoreductase YuxK